MSIFKSNSRVCGVARAGDHYFAVQLEQQAGALCVNNALAGMISDPASLDRLRRLLSSGPCYAAVSKVDEQENVVIRQIVITDLSSRKIAAAVRTQMEEHIHYPDYELTYGARNQTLAAGDAPGSSAARHVIAVSVPKTAIKDETTWWHARKLPLPALGVYALSGPNLFARLDNKSGRDILLITANVWGIDCSLLRDGALVYHRWADVSLEEEEGQRLSFEVGQTYSYVQKAFACKNVVLCLPPMAGSPVFPDCETMMFNPLEQEQMRFASGDVKALCIEHQYRACLAIGQALGGLA